MPKIRIMIADDNEILREGMRLLLEQEDDLEVVGEAGDGEEAIKLAADLKPDVVLMDVLMPKLSGIEATKQIKRANPATNILILAAYSDPRYVQDVMGAGASGTVLKNARSEELIQAIRSVYSGQTGIGIKN